MLGFDFSMRLFVPRLDEFDLLGLSNGRFSLSKSRRARTARQWLGISFEFLVVRSGGYEQSSVDDCIETMVGSSWQVAVVHFIGRLAQERWMQVSRVFALRSSR